MTLLLAVLVAGLTAVAVGQTPNSKVADVTNFKKLRSWGESSLYEIEASITYTTNPYLIHLIGTKYGQSSISQHDIVMYVCVWCWGPSSLRLERIKMLRHSCPSVADSSIRNTLLKRRRIQFNVTRLLMSLVVFVVSCMFFVIVLYVCFLFVYFIVVLYIYYLFMSIVLFRALSAENQSFD